MRKYPSLYYAGTIFIMAAFISNCNKSADWKETHFGNAIDACQPSKLIFNNDENATAVFTYNSKGDPESIKQAGKQLAVPVDYYFRYDTHDRLSDYTVTFYQSTGAFIWHRYSYPSANIIIDTQFNYVGSVTDPEPPHSSPNFYVNQLTLDQFGRIVKSKDLSSNIEQTFTYDRSGNLSSNGVTYDDKLNPYHTSKTWMLIYKDFSINNPLSETSKITKYNNFALPTQFETTNPNPSNYLFGYLYTAATVIYSCDTPRPPNSFPGK